MKKLIAIFVGVLCISSFSIPCLADFTTADLNGNGFVNFEDFAILASQWLTDTSDLNFPGVTSGLVAQTSGTARAGTAADVYNLIGPVATLNASGDIDPNLFNMTLVSPPRLHSKRIGKVVLCEPFGGDTNWIAAGGTVSDDANNHMVASYGSNAAGLQFATTGSGVYGSTLTKTYSTPVDINQC
jgi:hypothetical protein